MPPPSQNESLVDSRTPPERGNQASWYLTPDRRQTGSRKGRLTLDSGDVGMRGRRYRKYSGVNECKHTPHTRPPTLGRLSVAITTTLKWLQNSASRTTIFFIAIVLLAVATFGSSSLGRGNVSASGSLYSWNPNVHCVPDLVTIRDVLGPAYPHQNLNGSRYQVNSTSGGIPLERSLSPPCTITNMTGQVVSPFVQINGVSLYGYAVKTTDCSAWYSKQNGGQRYPGNQTYCTDGGQIITLGTTSGYLRIEVDRDWLGKGYCGPNVPSCDNATLFQEQSNGTISIDVQGFVFWEGPWHWELHPFTAWKLSSSPPPPPPSPPDFSLGASPNSLTFVIGSSGTSTITLTSISGLAGTASLSASVSSSDLILIWPTASVSPSSVTLTANGTATSTLSISTSLLTTPGTYTVTVSATVGSITHSTSVLVKVVIV